MEQLRVLVSAVFYLLYGELQIKSLCKQSSFQLSECGSIVEDIKAEDHWTRSTIPK